MSLTLPALWRSRGRHRAADQLALVEAERDRLAARNAHLQNALGHADELITRVCRRGAANCAEAEQLRAELDTLTEAHALLESENDELAARNTALRQELANLRAISSPAPADGKPAIPLRGYDPEATVPTPVYGLWDAIGNPPAAAA